MKTLLKKSLTVGLVALLFALALPGLAFAAESPQNKAGYAVGAGLGTRGGSQVCLYKNSVAFIDADGDGICDNRNLGLGRGSCFVDSDGDGICDNCGLAGVPRALGTTGACYIDANGDGICDYHGVAGCGYVDADGNGVCDNRGTQGGHHQGMGRGHHGR